MRSKQRKAILAIAFASGILCSPVPAFPEDGSDVPETIEQKIVNNTQITPEERAFFLLTIARDYLNGYSKDYVEASHVSCSTAMSRPWTSGDWEVIIRSWKMRRPSRTSIHDGLHHVKNAFHSSRSESQNIRLAEHAITLALEQLQGKTEAFPRLGLRLIALELLRETGNILDSEKCNKAFETDLSAFEGSQSTDEDHIKSAISVLNALSNTLIPVYISNFESSENQKLNNQPRIRPFTESEFKESEVLQLRALKLADRLGSENHTRRKAHRDMYFWYIKLGKVAQAEKEKQLLFNLLGSKDESLLNPKSGFCGHVVWWRTTEVSSGLVGCGMG